MKLETFIKDCLKNDEFKKYWLEDNLPIIIDVTNKSVLELSCPKCNKELPLPSLHTDGFEFCANAFRCDCGEIIELRHFFDDNKTYLICPASKEIVEIMNIK